MSWKTWFADRWKYVQAATYKAGDEKPSFKALAEVLKGIGVLYLACSESVVKVFEAFSLPKTNPAVHLVVAALATFVLVYMVLAREDNQGVAVYVYPRFARWVAMALSPVAALVTLFALGRLVALLIWPHAAGPVGEVAMKTYLNPKSWVEVKSASSDARKTYRANVDEPEEWKASYRDLSLELYPSAGFTIRLDDCKAIADTTYPPDEEPGRRIIEPDRGSVRILFRNFQPKRGWQLTATVERVDATKKFARIPPLDGIILFHE